MVIARIRQLVDRLSVKAIFNRLDKRKLQNELDTHRLYLVTSHFDRLKAGRVCGDSYVQDLAAEAQQLGHEGMQSAIAEALQKQFTHISAAMHDYLRQAKDPMPAAAQATLAELRQKQHTDALSAPKSRRPRGLAAAVGASVSRLDSAPLVSPSQSTPGPASSSSALGYSLEVRTSGIAHQDAGDGLWLRGTAPVGAVVGLYPGLVYEPMHYRKLPGYPKIDTHNDYFLARFDGALIDGQSWGRGRPTLDPTTQHVDAQYHNTHHAMLAKLHQKEMRHPLALAHYANHPPAGMQPNVMVAAFTYNKQQGEDAWLAAYMPNVMYHDAGGQQATQLMMQDQQIKGLVFVATRQVQGEEVLLNYRLNPQVQRPSWYAPVDEEEDKRRWY
ncbi:hypothetical protein WJX82_006842 [Trebouxia sp. C0006]